MWDAGKSFSLCLCPLRSAMRVDVDSYPSAEQLLSASNESCALRCCRAGNSPNDGDRTGSACRGHDILLKTCIASPLFYPKTCKARWRYYALYCRGMQLIHQEEHLSLHLKTEFGNNTKPVEEPLLLSIPAMS